MGSDWCGCTGIDAICSCDEVRELAARVKELEADLTTVTENQQRQWTEKDHYRTRAIDAETKLLAARARSARLEAALTREVMRPAADRQFCTLCRFETLGDMAVRLFVHDSSCVLAASPVEPDGFAMRVAEAVLFAVVEGMGMDMAARRRFLDLAAIVAGVKP